VFDGPRRRQALTADWRSLARLGENGQAVRGGPPQRGFAASGQASASIYRSLPRLTKLAWPGAATRYETVSEIPLERYVDPLGMARRVRAVDSYVAGTGRVARPRLRASTGRVPSRREQEAAHPCSNDNRDAWRGFLVVTRPRPP